MDMVSASCTASFEQILKVVNAEHHDPFCVLGIHKAKTGFAIRAYLPNAKCINVIATTSGHVYPMEKVHDWGFFEVIAKDKKNFFKYQLEVTDYCENTFTIHDPYSFPPILSECDLYLFNEGNQHKAFDKLGSHVCTVKGVKGTLFAVWAPCAKRVSVVGNFNQWDGRRHQMRCRGSSGVWEIFIPELGEGEVYKYEIKTASDEIYVKSDPYAFFSELRPNTASIIHDIDKDYGWNDSEWVAKRDEENPFTKPTSIYEVHLGSWKRVSEDENGLYNYREIADMLVPYVVDMGYTHVELMPIAEHPFDGSWGYQITGYYAVTSRYGSPEDFKYFVDKCHQNGIGVIIDWVPAHFPKDGHGLARFDGSALYEHVDSRQGEHPDWGTHIFNFGRNEVKNFLISNALFWIEKYHIDGLRVDAVASMLYLDYGKKDGEWLTNPWGGKENVDAIHFMRQLNSVVYSYFSNIMMIAEESTSWALVTKPPYVGGLGFSFKWNMGWMNDFLRYISMDPIYRKHHHDLLTFSFLYCFSENFILVLSHDEVVHGKCSMLSKMPGDYWQKFAGLRSCYGFMFAHPGKKLMFMGSEFGQFIEWNYKKSLDWNLLDYDMHRNMKRFVKDLNNIYKTEKALHEVDFSNEGFEWIDGGDTDHSIVTFMRKATTEDDFVVIVCNFTPVVHHNYKVGVPTGGVYDEILNSDADIYGGSNVGNFGQVLASDFGWHGRPYSLEISVPPLGVVMFKPKKQKA